jgi:hypothetical protein
VLLLKVWFTNRRRIFLSIHKRTNAQQCLACEKVKYLLLLLLHLHTGQDACVGRHRHRVRERIPRTVDKQSVLWLTVTYKSALQGARGDIGASEPLPCTAIACCETCARADVYHWRLQATRGAANAQESTLAAAAWVISMEQSICLVSRGKRPRVRCAPLARTQSLRATACMSSVWSLEAKR